MGLTLFDQSRENESGFYGEAVRLSNELREVDAHMEPDSMGNMTIQIPFKSGFDIESCSIVEIENWLNDKTIEKSQSLLMFVQRVFAVRFPLEYSQRSSIIDPEFKIEHEKIQSNAKNEVEWFGEVGYQNMVRLDGSLTNTRSRVVEDENGKIKIVRK